MLQENVVIEAEKRPETGKNAARRARAADMIPAVLYGGGKDTETLALAVPRKSLTNLFKKGLHDNAIFQVKVKGLDTPGHAMIRDLSVDPVSRHMLHVDFVRVDLDKKLRVKVSVECVGIPIGVKTEGGLLDTVTHEVRIECLPADIPHTIQIDVSHLHLKEAFRVSNLSLGDKLKVVEPPDRVLAHVTVLKHEEVAATATAEVAPTTAAEPEVIKKGKKEEEGAEAAKPEKKEKK